MAATPATQQLDEFGAAPVAEEIDVDMLLIGAGPTGLYGAYYAGFRGFSVAIMDTLPEAGGQVTAMYPDKLIYDVPGFVAVRGRELIGALLQQVAQFQPRFLLGHQAVSVEHRDEGVSVISHRGMKINAKTIVLTGGIGTFSPRPLPVGSQYIGRGLGYFITNIDEWKDKNALVVGGGDSAFDWAHMLLPIAKSVTLVHRRSHFRAHEHTVKQVMSGGARIKVDCEIAEIFGDGKVQAVDIMHKPSQSHERVNVDGIIAALGFTAELGPLAMWGFDIEQRRVKVDSTMFTGVPRIYAAGNITEYPGKLPLISVGFGEAATAVNNAAPIVNPAIKVFPGHSSSDAQPEKPIKVETTEDGTAKGLS